MTRWLPLLLVALGAAAYSNSHTVPFLLDDGWVIERHASLRDAWPSVLRSRGLVDLTLALNHGSVAQPVNYHLVNFFIHVLAGLVLYGILRRTFRRLGWPAAKTCPWMAAVCAGAWLVHPVQTQSVTYVCQRYESMMGLFYLLSLYGFVRWIDSDYRRGWAVGCVTACVLGFGAKEVMVTAPLLIGLYDYVFISRSMRELLRRHWRLYAALAVAWVLAAGMLYGPMVAPMIGPSAVVPGVEGTGTVGGVAGRLTPGVYAMTQFGVILRYLQVSVWPRGLCFDYGWPAAAGWRDVVLPAAFLLLLGSGSLYGLCRKRPWSYPAAWFFLILLPTSSIVVLEDPAAEHRLYLPLAGVVVLAIAAGYELTGRLPSAAQNSVRATLSILLLIGLTTLTVGRNNIYQSEERLWQDVVDKREDNLRARVNLGVELCRRGGYERGCSHLQFVIDRTADVAPVRERQRLSAVTPVYNRFQAFTNLGIASLAQGRTNEAVNAYVDALRVYPYSDFVEQKLEQTLLATGVPENELRNEIMRRLWQEDADRNGQ